MKKKLKAKKAPAVTLLKAERIANRQAKVIFENLRKAGVFDPHIHKAGETKTVPAPPKWVPVETVKAPQTASEILRYIERGQNSITGDPMLSLGTALKLKMQGFEFTTEQIYVLRYVVSAMQRFSLPGHDMAARILELITTPKKS